MHDEDAEILCSSEPEDELTPIIVDVSPPTSFADTVESRTVSESKLSETPKPESSASNETLSLVARLRLAASEQEKVMQEEREKREKERMEEIRKAELEERERMEREEAEKIERERLEREEEEARKALEKAREEEMEREKEERKRLEKEREEKEKKQREERERAERRGEEQREGEALRGQKSQPNVVPPLREAELDDIADDERLQEAESPKPGPSVVLTRPADSVQAAKPINNKPAAKKPTGPVRSVRKHGAIPAWLREDDDEEIEYETGQEDLGSIWLAELYMEGEAG